MGILAEFSELIKNFDKIRDYMRDFFIYGFKARVDFKEKSPRTYDNERRRIESYLGNYIKWDTAKGGKRVFISLDSSKIAQNPLYSAWKSKSFTDNDIMLHFYILDTLNEQGGLTIEEITDTICNQSGVCFDPQTVRIKVKEYVKAGMLYSEKKGKALYFSLSKDTLCTITSDYEELTDAIKFYQEAAPIGVVGSYILDNEALENDLFTFKHHFIVHTLEDNILLQLLKAMIEKRRIRFLNQSTRLSQKHILEGIPLRIFVSSQSGRRYVTVYNDIRGRFIHHRLDYIKQVELMDPYEEYDTLKKKLDENLNRCWGVSFGGYSRGQKIRLKLFIDEEREAYILNRLKREGRGGEIQRVEENVYLYTKEVFDANEMMPWIKTFTGRILSLEGAGDAVTAKFYEDMKRMSEMYLEEEEA